MRAFQRPGGDTLLVIVGDGQGTGTRGVSRGSRGSADSDPDPLRLSVWALGRATSPAGRGPGPAGGPGEGPALLTAWGKRHVGGWLWGRTRPAFTGWSIEVSPLGDQIAVSVPGHPLQLFHLQVLHTQLQQKHLQEL
jgi:hypothetical protein